MNLLPIAVACMWSAACLAVPPQPLCIAAPQTGQTLVEKGNNHHEERGRRGKRGKQGKDAVHLAYIERAEIIGDPNTPFFLTKDTILPLGNYDTGIKSAHLKYVDPTPTVTTADRYIKVLHKGAGTYLIEWSITAISDVDTPTAPLITRLEIGNSKGVYDQTRAPDLFLPITNAAGVTPVVFSSGTRTDIVSLHKGDRLHIRVVEDPTQDLALRPLPENGWSVSFTMSRIASRKQSH